MMKAPPDNATRTATILFICLMAACFVLATYLHLSNRERPAPSAVVAVEPTPDPLADQADDTGQSAEEAERRAFQQEQAEAEPTPLQWQYVWPWKPVTPTPAP